jgi:K+/H+ antiporter YhaU regulatory subunit KhtT
MVKLEKFSPSETHARKKRVSGLKRTRSSPDQISKLISIETTMQSRIAELLTGMTELLERMDHMVSLLEKAGEVEETPSNVSKQLVEQIKIMNQQNKEIANLLATLKEKEKTGQTKNLLRQAMGKKFSEL